MSFTVVLADLRARLGDQVQEQVLLAPYTSARIGGPADILVTVRSADELADVVQYCWAHGQAFHLFGAGSNLLVSDKGIRGVVILNRARKVEFVEGPEKHVWAESGAIFSNLARRAAAQGFAGLEWASTIPGTVGGAVYGNAGAFGGDVAQDLLAVAMLTPSGREWWPARRMEYGYRTSLLKRKQAQAVILAAKFNLKFGRPAEIQARIDQFNQRRKAAQPPGASMGSMFKNPDGDYAGRLIEAAGLKGARIGNAEISRVHANFFINTGESRAEDVKALIELARQTVDEKFGIKLELEVELAGEW